MAKFEVGVLRNFEGKVGTVVGAKWKGIEYMGHKGRKRKKDKLCQSFKLWESCIYPYFPL